MRLAELCAGYGGLAMGLALAGIDTELVCYAENDIHAAKVLAHHHPEVPNLDDLTRITDPPPVDIITAGFPCQPVSVAGRREGTEDERWIIDDVCRVARLAGARWLVLENVTGLLTANDGNAMGRVCAALAFEGFSRWEWTTIRASDIGAPHRRERWFCVAHNADSVVGSPPVTFGDRVEERYVGVGSGIGAGYYEAAPDTDGESTRRNSGTTPRTETRRENEPGQSDSHRPRNGRATTADTAGHAGRISDRNGQTPTDTDGSGCTVERVGGIREDGDAQPGRDVDGCDRARFGGYAEAVHHWEHIIGRAAPDPTADGRLNPVFVEWMMGLPEGHVTGVPDLTRPQQLKILGNGVVPLQAAAAVTELCLAAVSR